MNYGTLKTSIANYLHRTDLTAVIPDFIDQARVRIGGDFRGLANFTVGTVTGFTAGLTALPTNLGKLAGVRDSAGSALNFQPLDQVVQWSTGVYSVSGSNLYVPTAGSATVVTLAYYAIPTALVNAGDVSVPMVQYPQIWLFASLVEAALYIRDLELVAAMNEAYELMIANANRAGNEARFGPAPAVIGDQLQYQSISTL